MIVHILFRGKRTEFTRTFAQQMALRIGTMHALVVAFVFSSLTGQLIELYQMSNTEAISAANVYWALKNNQTPEAVELRKLIPDYLQTVVEKDWKAPYKSPQNLPAWELITRMKEIVAKWRPSASADEIIRNHVFNNINTVAENRDRRIIERVAPNLPLVFWLIAIIGYLLSLVPYLTVEHSKLRFTLVCCYAIIIGLLFYGIAELDNPYLGQVIHPTAFEVKLQEIVAGQ
ncbi:MAG: DUF4239 domain-containing protein [Deltaproteobacteria bacterium]|nr:DUF4239 domain-containing protein [Deltaproteobacteria bacterium]